jgi:hypothetical protein
MTNRPRTVAEKNLTPASREILFALLDEEDVLRLDSLLPMIVNEPAWWLQKEIRERATAIQLTRAALKKRGP